MNAHSKLVNDVLLKIGSLDYCRVWKQHVGLFDIPDTEFSIKIGVPGMSDIGGIVSIKNKGIYLAVECKTGNAVQSKKQKNFERMVDSLGGIYFVAHSPEEAFDKIKAIKDFFL